MAQEILVNISVNSGKAVANVKNVDRSFKNLSKTVQRIQKQGQSERATAGIDNAILIETSRLASDVNFGFTAIANNLSQLINLFKQGNQAAGGFAARIKSLLRFQNLLLIAVQAAISLLPRLLKKYKDAAINADSFAKAIREANASIADQILEIRALTAAIDEGNLSYERNQTLIERLQKATKQRNIEIDSSNKLTKDSNELIEKSIKLMQFEAEAKAILALIDAETKASLEEIAKIRAAENTALNKFTTLTVTIYESIVNSVTNGIAELQRIITFTIDLASQIPVIGSIVEGVAKGIDTVFTVLSSGFSKITGILQAPIKLLEQYEAAVNSSDQQSRRKAETDEKLAEIQKELNERTAKYKERLKELFTSIAELNLRETKTIKNKEKLIKLERELDLITKLQLKNASKQEQAVVTLGDIREKYFRLNQDYVATENKNTLQQIDFEEKMAINRIQNLIQYGVTADQVAQATHDAQVYYSRLTTERIIEENKLRQAANLETYQFIAESIGNVSEIAKEYSDLQKGLAIAEIAANTAISYVQGLKLAQEVGKEAPIAKAAVFAAFYASQIAAVTRAAARAKQILNGAPVGGEGGQGFQQPVTAPAFNVVGASPVDQLAELVGGALSPEGGLNFNVNANVNPIDLDLVSDQFNSDESQAGIGG